MIITKKYALELIAKGSAEQVGFVNDNGTVYGIINRLDIQRTDHYKIA